MDSFACLLWRLLARSSFLILGRFKVHGFYRAAGVGPAKRLGEGLVEVVNKCSQLLLKVFS